MQTSNKHRTPSKCREWERQRRNKFNEAISKLGEIVKTISKANNNSADGETDNVQYPKIEIIQKAIICLTNYAQEKTQLKAEILALEVKLEASKKSDKKDVSVQVSFVNKKNQNGKHVKIIKLQRTKQQANEEPKPSEDKVDSKTDKHVIITPSQDKVLPKLPKLLPLTNNNKKGAENTLLMLPAAPYIFPQRPLLFPTVPPTIVLVDTNLQPLNKPSPIPIINRSSTDITRTTMVNILPISAYSRPLSATKSRKHNTKQKSNKKPKKLKVEDKGVSSIPDINKEKCKENSKQDCAKSNNNIGNISDNDKRTPNSPSIEDNTNTTIEKSLPAENIHSMDTNEVETSKKIVEKNAKNSDIDLKNDTSLTTSEKSIIDETPPPKAPKSTHTENNSVGSMRTNKITLGKETPSDDKNKDTKLSNILEATICENVDGGNARLELAEELLAASPTAAFLMSFPLVSGNRADSPADETQNPNSKDSNLRRTEIPSQHVPFFEKPNTLNSKIKSPSKNSNTVIATNKPDEQKYFNNNVITSKAEDTKTSNVAIVTSASSENPFLNLPMTSLISTSCSLSDSAFGIEFDCNINKTTASQPTSYVNSSNIFYKSDPFNSVKNSIYSTSSISSGHDFNSLGLYPCTMEKYTTKKSDYSNVEDNLMKIGSSRLTYDIDLGWSHKSFDFVNCTTSANTFNKDSLLTSVTTAYSTSYNPFNPDFHVPLVSNSNKKDHVASKPSTSFPETISSLYSQTTNLWTDDVPTYNNPNLSKNYSTKQNYHSDTQAQSNINLKTNVTKQYEVKLPTDANIVTNTKPTIIAVPPHHMLDTKKSSSKMHINWMTSEIRPMQNNCNQSQAEIKSTNKMSYSQINHVTRKQDHNDSNYFPINMHNYPTQSNQEEFQVWPTTRPAGTTEISIDPPPINLPTLVGDLALGPHDKKKTEMIGQRVPQADLQNCSTFLSVTQLMNRSTDNMSSRYYGSNIEAPKTIPTKQNVANVSDTNRKAMPSRLEANLQPNYIFNEPKQTANNYENMVQFTQSKTKQNKGEKSAKLQKNNYSAESLIRGGTCSQKTLDNSSMKFIGATQKYNDYITQDSSVAQVSHFPPIIDYSDNNYTGQQFSGTTLYNSTTNTISNSFYSNFMPGGTNLMTGNYASGPFPTDFIDYNQSAECNYSNHKYEELKMKNNPTIFHQDKLPTTYKSTRRESAAKHKLECCKKESNKKYQSKRTKVNNDTEEWNDTSHLLWQNKTAAKRHSNIMSEEIPFPNYVANQMPSQYQADFFNSHLMSTNMQNMGHHNVDRSIASFPVTSRANFNLSTIFPEITMKVQ